MPSDTLEGWLKGQRGAENFSEESPSFQAFFREVFDDASILMANSGGTMSRNEAMPEVLIKVWEGLEERFRANTSEEEVSDSRSQ